MKITCPSCSTNNPMQEYCGNCGEKLSKETSTKEKVNYTWLKGIGWFLLIYLIGGTILSFLTYEFSLNIRYEGGISFVVGIVYMLYYVMSKKDQAKDAIEDAKENNVT